MLSMGLTRNFQGKKKKKKGGAFSKSEGGGRKIFTIKILHQAPLTSVCERSLSRIFLKYILTNIAQCSVLY